MQINLTQQELEEVYKWIDEIPLSRPKRNVARDFSDAVLMAEIIAHYNPNIIQLHNFIAAGSLKQKIVNWSTLQQKVLKKLKIKLSKENIESLAGSENQTIERLILIVKRAIQKGEMPSPSIISKTTTKLSFMSNLNADSRPKPMTWKQIKKRKDVKQFIQAKDSQIQQLKKILEVLIYKQDKLQEILKSKDKQIEELVNRIKDKFK